MKYKIIAFGASNSKNSINKSFATHAAHQLQECSVEILDLNDFEMPIYSIDREKTDGIPQKAIDFKEKLKEASGVVISFAEHNGAYSVAFKNVMDWISRIDSNVWENKPMLLLSTSPGARGGQTVLNIAMAKFKFMASGELMGFSLPSFYDNFSEEKGITDAPLDKEFRKQLRSFQEVLEKQ